MPGRTICVPAPTQQEVSVTTLTMTPMPHARIPSAQPHIAVQVLGLLLFGGFAIVATILALVFFLPAGIALAIFLVVYGFRPIISPRHARHTADSVMGAPIAADHSGNRSFDAYRADVLQRLEEEQTRFEGFLARLRDAKDKSEFDTFMDDRARTNRDADTPT
jgi:uncharacterized protein YjeT (DUF2065 family)